MLEDVGDRTVSTDISADSHGKFDEFLPEAQEMLKTVEWKGA